MGNGFSSHHKSGRFDRDHGYNDDDDFSNGDDVGDESGSSTVVLLSVKAVDANRRDVSPIPVTQFDEEEKRISFAEGVLFSRVHATLQPALSVGRSVGR